MHHLSEEQLIEISKKDTPSIANAIEMLTDRSAIEGFNKEVISDYMPEMGTMVGYVVTVEVCSSRPSTDEEKPAFENTLRLIEQAPKPIVVVMKDIDSPNNILGSMWGYVTANTYKAMGVNGVIVDGAVRDLPEMSKAGFRAMARRVCVSHGYGHHIDSGKPVEVFGTIVKTGDLIAADQHGFVIIPHDCASRVVEFSNILDKLEDKYLVGPSQEDGYCVDVRLEYLNKFKEEMSKIKK